MKYSSYLQLCFHVDGYDDKYLRVPTLKDSRDGKWRAFLKLPVSRKLIHSEGDTVEEMSNSFVGVLADCWEMEEFSSEIMGLFRPLSEWEEDG